MISFRDVKLVNKAAPFVMPALESHYLTRRMREAGIELKYYSWRDVICDRAPLGYDEAIDNLYPFEQEGAFSVTPCVIVSRVVSEDMLERALCMVRTPVDPDYAIFMSAHAKMKAVVTNEPAQTRVPTTKEGVDHAHDLLLCDKRAKDALTLRRRCGHGINLFGPEDVLLANRIVREVSHGTLARQDLRSNITDNDSDCGQSIAPIGANLRDQVSNVLFELGFFELDAFEHMEGSFTDEAQATFALEEAVASMSLEIARWINRASSRQHQGKNPIAQFYFEVDPSNYEFPEQMRFEGIIGDAHSLSFRHMRTSSIRAELEICEDEPLGFAVRRIEPDFSSLGAEPTGADLREYAREILHERERRWSFLNDPIDLAVAEYRFDSNCSVEVWCGVEYIAIDDFHFAAVEIPADSSALSQTVYLEWNGTYLVTRAGAVRRKFYYYPIATYSGPEDEHGIEFWKRSDAPNAGLYDCRVRLEDPGMFEAFRAAHPDIAEVVADLRRTAASYEQEHNRDEETPEKEADFIALLSSENGEKANGESSINSVIDWDDIAWKGGLEGLVLKPERIPSSPNAVEDGSAK